MQELLGRIARLDPSASLGLRVIACFDELVVGGVGTRGLLAAAASLAACPAGFRSSDPDRTLRVGPRGQLLTDDPPDHRTSAAASAGLEVWLERDGPEQPNDAITLERLALAVRIRHGRGRDALDDRRHMSVLTDRETTVERRRGAAASLGLREGPHYRIAVAPLFAVWQRHPDGPEDVVSTRYGPLHVLALVADHQPFSASPCGVGVAVTVDHLDHSFRTALAALRLCDPPRDGMVPADRYGGLIDLLADSPDDLAQPDADRLAQIADQPWGLTTVDALISTQSVREAARRAGVHHSTLATRVGMITDLLGFDPLDGMGRARLSLAYLCHRIRSSSVLDLPAPTTRERR